jgi:hypothetical protein
VEVRQADIDTLDRLGLLVGGNAVSRDQVAAALRDGLTKLAAIADAVEALADWHHAVP